MSNKATTAEKLEVIKMDITNLEYRIACLRKHKQIPFFLIGVANPNGDYVENPVILDQDIYGKVKLLINDFVSEQLERCELEHKKMTDPLQIALRLSQEN